MAPPKLHVREIQPSPSDLDSLIRLVMAAFAGTRLHRLVFPNPILVDGFNVEEHVWRVGHVTRSLSDTTRHHVVVVEETEVDGVKHEEYAGYAVWQNPPDSDTPEKTPEERERDKQEAMSHWPPSMDKENMKMLIEESEKLEKQCLGDVHGDGAKNFWSELLSDIVPPCEDGLANLWYE